MDSREDAVRNDDFSASNAPQISISATPDEWASLCLLASYTVSIYQHEELGRPMPNLDIRDLVGAIGGAVDLAERIEQKLG